MEAPGLLNLISGIMILVAGILAGTFASYAIGLGWFSLFGAIIVGWGIIVGLLLIVSGMKYEKNKNWAIVGLVFSILGLVTFQGFIIGPILGIIGSALALKK